MKVVHITAYLDPALGYEENHLGPVQAELGADVAIITSNVRVGATAARGKFDTGRSEYKGTTLYRQDTVGFPCRQPAMGLRKLGEAIDASEPDIIHVHSPVGLLFVQAMRACKQRDLPVVLDSHLCYFNLNPYSWLKRRYYSVHKNFLLPRYRDQIKALLPQTPDSGKLLMAELGVKEDEMVQITLGTDTDQFRPDLEGGKRVRSRFGLGEEVPVIVFVGRVVPEKRIETIIEALGVPELSESHLMIVGPVDDAYRGALLSGVSDTVKDRIIFTGGVDHEELPAYFSAADVGVWPGDGAISIIDAMACGLPVVVSRLDSSSHLISSGNGEAFDQGDSGELSRVLHGIISDADRRSKMSGLSMTAVENIFDWRRVAGRTLAIYDDVLSDRPSSVPTIW